ncbi:hypothetical protein [Rugamonas sp. DEMB1]|uniref:hypothetical protein n=1 Tax=Rugamonas sp. DEMB1 TaxID=3039386 RepID=UPI00244793D7|nr:hypothetical protein [Rugamonas sp. DEMB1]WGG52028.1 hypothetical protein QC826_07530 [Rugamonas sp. DEMB1]
MQITEAAPQTELLVAELPAGRPLAPSASLAVRRMGELEGAVNQLRDRLAAMPAGEACAPQRREEIGRLLSQVALFRLALTDKK